MEQLVNPVNLVNLALYLGGPVFTAGAIWGAMRADIKRLHEKADAAHDEASRAHNRIDSIFTSKG